VGFPKREVVQVNIDELRPQDNRLLRAFTKFPLRNLRQFTLGKLVFLHTWPTNTRTILYHMGSF
jgi:hypothetical protein